MKPQRRFSLLVLCAWFYLAEAVGGQWVEVSGRSAFTGDVVKARQEAINDAISRALLTQGAHVQSRTSVHQQTQVTDTLAIQALGSIAQLTVLDESTEDSIFTVRVKLLVQPQERDDCAGSSGRKHKSILFATFPRAVPQQSRMGQLDNIDWKLPQELLRRSYDRGLLVGKFVEQTLAESAQEWGSATASVDQIRRLAQHYQAQYVVAGSVDNLAMENHSEYARTSELGYRYNASVGSFLGTSPLRDPRMRQFEFHLRVFDGISGEVVMDRIYGTEGKWSAKRNQMVGFASADFWRLDYGKQVDQLLDQAAGQLGEKLACQPFMVPIQQVATRDGVLLDAGANNGVKVGDVFQVYRQDFITPHDANYGETLALRRLALEQTSISVTVTQVHPGYSSATLSEPLMGERRYLGIIW